MSETITQMETKNIPKIIRKDFIKDGVNKYREIMKKENLEYMICETEPNGLIHKEYWLCENQVAVDYLLDGDMPSTMWYVSDKDKSIKLSIDFDWRLGELACGSWTEGEEYYKKICEDFKDNIIGIADRSRETKFSKRIYTNLEFQNTETLKYYVLDYIKKNNYSKDVVDTSIFTKNRLYPVVGRNVKKDTPLKWEGGGNFETCNPHNKMDSVKKHFDIPTNIKERKKHAKSNLQKKINSMDKKDINSRLFLQFLNIIPADHWDNYNEWFKLGTFCKSFFDFELFHQISRCGDNYGDEESCKKLYDSISKTINAGFVVNVAKSYNEEEVRKIYASNRFSKETLTESLVAEQSVYYFGNFFLRVDAALFHFNKDINCWKPFDRYDLIYFLNNELYQYIKPHIETEDEKIQKKIQARFHSIKSSGLDKVCKFFFDFLKPHKKKLEILDNCHKHKIFFTNGYFDILKNNFNYIKDQEWYNTVVIDREYVWKTDIKKKQRLIDFFDKIFPNKPDFEIFKNMIGKAVAGIHQKKMLIVTGYGNNGKSSLFPLIQYALNNYMASTGSCEILTESMSVGKPRNDLQMLQNKKIVVIQEPPSQIKFNSCSIKQITGGDTISCRGYFQKTNVNFINTALIIVSCNSIPELDKVDRAMADRLVTIEMRSRFLAKQEYDLCEDKTNIYLADTYYKDPEFFEDHKDVCMNIMLEWAREYKDKELEITEDIRNMNQSYLEDLSCIEWFKDNFEPSNEPKCYLKLNDIYVSFKQVNTDNMICKKFIDTFKEHPEYARDFYKIKTINGVSRRSVLMGYKSKSTGLLPDSDNDD
jgi:phage/plasmid-associated DNA primase